MIYEHRTYYLLPGKLPEFLTAFEGTPMKVFERHGAKLVGFWTTEIGQSNEITYILAYNSLADMEQVKQKIGQDEEMIKYRQQPPRVEKVVAKILRPSAFSPLK